MVETRARATRNEPLGNGDAVGRAAPAAEDDELTSTGAATTVEHAAQWRALHARQMEEEQKSLLRRFTKRGMLLWHQFGITFAPFMLTPAEQCIFFGSILLVLYFLLAACWRVQPSIASAVAMVQEGVTLIGGRLVEITRREA